MTSVGLLGRQYLGSKHDGPMLTGGVKYLMDHLPDESMSNIYYWYYATQVMHNMSGYEWDTWNRTMRNLLVKTQVRNVDECANGSWNPEQDHWGKRGGRVMQTSLSALTLEIYYRYLPIFKAEAMPGADATSLAPATTTNPKEKDEEKPEKKEPDKFKKVDRDGIKDTPPAELDADPTLEKPLETPATQPKRRAVEAALDWLARHQDDDGHWSLTGFINACKDKTCTGAGEHERESAATAMGLLPFLAAGQTHKAKGTYRERIGKGIAWLMKHQQPDGDLAKGEPQMMYSHGLATIALCEAYGLTGDAQVGRAAQGAVNFILADPELEGRRLAVHAQGCWRYLSDRLAIDGPEEHHLAGLDIGKAGITGANNWLDSVAVHDGTEYCYMPGIPPRNTMTCGGPARPTISGHQARQPHAYRRHEVPDGSLARRERFQHLLLVLRHPGHA